MAICEKHSSKTPSHSVIITTVFAIVIAQVIFADKDTAMRENAIKECKSENIYKKDDFYCCSCEPGTYLKSDCDVHGGLSDPTHTVCQPCPFDKSNPMNQTYTSEFNQFHQCNVSITCAKIMNTVRITGSAKSGSRCECVKGTFSRNSNMDNCKDYLKCRPGFGVARDGNMTHDVECERCEDGFDSPDNSSTQRCQRNEFWNSNSTEIPTSSLPAEKQPELVEKTWKIVAIVFIVAFILTTIILFIIIIKCIILRRNNTDNNTIPNNDGGGVSINNVPNNDGRNDIPNNENVEMTPLANECAQLIGSQESVDENTSVHSGQHTETAESTNKAGPIIPPINDDNVEANRHEISLHAEQRDENDDPLTQVFDEGAMQKIRQNGITDDNKLRQQINIQGGELLTVLNWSEYAIAIGFLRSHFSYDLFEVDVSDGEREGHDTREKVAKIVTKAHQENNRRVVYDKMVDEIIEKIKARETPHNYG